MVPYERLLLDAMAGDATLYAKGGRSERLEICGSIWSAGENSPQQSILMAIRQNLGPRNSDDLMEEWLGWRNPETC